MPRQSPDRLRITPNTPVEDLEKRLSRSVSTAGSEARRQYLERTARWVTGVEVVVELIESGTASCSPTDNGGDADYHVRIPKTSPQQQITDLDEDVWTLLFQEVELLHELGHVLYTDFEAAREARDAYEGTEEETFHTYLNILEDGAVERELAAAFRLRDDLAVKNHNLFDGEQRAIQTLDGAIQTALFDRAKHDTGTLSALLDEDGETEWAGSAEDYQTFIDNILPLCRSAVDTVCTNPDPSARIDAVVDFFEAVSEYLTFDTHENQYDGQMSMPVGSEQMGNKPESAATLSASGSDDSGQSGDDSTGGSEDTQSDDESSTGVDSDSDDEDADEDAGGSTGAGDADQRGEEPTEGGGEEGDEEEDADGESDEQDGEEAAGDAGDGSSRDSGSPEDRTGDDAGSGDDTVAGAPAEATPSGGSDSGGEPSSDETQTPADRADGGGAGLESPDVSRYERQVRRERAETQPNGTGDNVLRREARDYARIISEMDGIGSLEIPLVSNEEAWSRDQWKKTEREARRLKRAFDRRLQNESEDQMKRHQLMGHLDTRAIHRTKQGDARVFQRMVFPNSKDYSCVIVLDRSSSMSDRIETAEIATTALAVALHELGVNVTVLGMPGKPMLDMPFESDPKQFRETLLSNHTSGGTPLGKTLALARERVRGQNGYPFVIVVTDGKAGDKDQYFKELKRTRFPVLGVYIDESGQHAKEVKNYFDRVALTDPSGLGRQLKRMAEGIMF